jgi:hypothetical protein
MLIRTRKHGFRAISGLFLVATSPASALPLSFMNRREG